MNFEDAIKYAIDGKAILFAGAGFSTEAINQLDKPFKWSKELCEQLCEELNISTYYDLGYLSSRYIKEKGADELIALLQKEYICKNFTQSHSEISKLNWKRIYTTNYDDIIEKASDNLGKAKIPITLGMDPSECKNKDDLVIHLNGYIKSISSDKLHKEFKLSRESYINDDFTDSKWATLFRHDLDSAKAIFFVGYSLKYDIDIQRIINKTKNLKDKCFFITSTNENEITRDIMSSFGRVESIGITNFAKQISSISANYLPVEYKEKNYYSFEELNKKNITLNEITDKNIIDLLVKGQINFSHLYNYGEEEGKYFVHRYEVERIIEDLEKCFNVAVIHSHLGNGKTGFIYSLGTSLIKKGDKVFLLKNIKDTFAEEFERISKLRGRKYIIIENYNLYIKYIKIFKLYRDINTKFIFTARSFINDVFYNNLISSLDIDESEVGIYELNKLNNLEIKSLIKLLNEYHLWGANANLNNNSKYRMIKSEYKGSFQNILLGLLESDSIANKLNEILKIMETDTLIKDIVIISFIDNILNLDLDLDNIIYLLGHAQISASIVRNPEINELINIEQNSINVKSSIFAQYIIRNKIETNNIIELLIKLMKAADNKALDEEYYNLMKLLVSFSNLRLVFNESNISQFSDYIIKYYENIKNLQFNRKNPFFWFQYAIARLDLKQYAEAKMHFENAYAYADDRPNFDKFQLNTHYARYLLEKEIYEGKDHTSALDSFLKAHNLIYENKNKPSHLHYPLRHGKHYYDFYNKFYSKFSPSEQATFLLCCHQILGKIEEYNTSIRKQNRQKHYDVEEAEQKIRLVIRNIQRSERILQQ